MGIEFGAAIPVSMEMILKIVLLGFDAAALETFSQRITLKIIVESDFGFKNIYCGLGKING